MERLNRAMEDGEQVTEILPCFLHRDCVVVTLEKPGSLHYRHVKIQPIEEGYYGEG